MGALFVTSIILITLLIAAGGAMIIVARRYERKQRKSLSGSVGFKSKLKMKALRPGFRKPFIEQVVGDDLHRKSGRWMKLTRRIDRLNKWYHEEVVDPTTGQIIHRCDEPLPNHRGHGSAKQTQQ